MESISIPNRRTEKRKTTDSEILDNIIQEYCLKRNQFNPRKTSPNLFSKKLQHRMKQYYNTLSSSPSKY
tara:strand:+ start:661 stop:867 length:207 start_codon:yes stop_codon:yes gene_type:complete